MLSAHEIDAECTDDRCYVHVKPISRQMQQDVAANSTGCRGKRNRTSRQTEQNRLCNLLVINISDALYLNII